MGWDGKKVGKGHDKKSQRQGRRQSRVKRVKQRRSGQEHRYMQVELLLEYISAAPAAALNNDARLHVRDARFWTKEATTGNRFSSFFFSSFVRPTLPSPSCTITSTVPRLISLDGS